ncbi:hypothetical protein KQUDLBSD_CDS0045 [Staphylococcus phage PG-2021_40]
MTKYTKHGETRIRKRQKIKKKNVQKEIDLAFKEGLTHSECKGKLGKYVTRCWFNHKHSYARVYKNSIYFFSNSNDTFLTVYPLPGNLQSTYQECMRKKNK